MCSIEAPINEIPIWDSRSRLHRDAAAASANSLFNTTMLFPYLPVRHNNLLFLPFPLFSLKHSSDKQTLQPRFGIKSAQINLLPTYYQPITNPTLGISTQTSFPTTPQVPTYFFSTCFPKKPNFIVIFAICVEVHFTSSPQETNNADSTHETIYPLGRRKELDTHALLHLNFTCQSEAQVLNAPPQSSSYSS